MVACRVFRTKSKIGVIPSWIGISTMLYTKLSLSSWVSKWKAALVRMLSFLSTTWLPPVTSFVGSPLKALKAKCRVNQLAVFEPVTDDRRSFPCVSVLFGMGACYGCQSHEKPLILDMNCRR
ncbi:hypothetical protein F5Y05DRAFT_71702 [Hypoxylon sp. FL0543]|nr:hypothetical protein F5Y05DRAFT_71702 [Hypoxylon sp. FL0543]